MNISITKDNMYQMIYQSPIGKIKIQSDGVYLTGLSFQHKKDEITKVDSEIDLPIFKKTVRWLDIYFRGEIPDFIPNYKLENLTPFRKKVIDILNEIPYGEVVSYQKIADQIRLESGREKMSAQAVGGAVGFNPICIIIPCHRVIGSNGSLKGYSGGVKTKEKLLELEKSVIRKKKGTKL